MRRISAALTALALSAAVPGLAAAQGFAVNEHGTCTMGRAGTGVAKPCADGSAILFNPAGLGAGGPGGVVSAGVTFIAAGGDFTSDYTGESWDLNNSPIPIPHAYVAYGVNDKLSVGIGLFVPYGLGTRWDSVTFDGRFLGYDNDLRSIYIQPTVSYRIHPKIAVGGGFDMAIGSVKLKQMLDLAEFPVPGQPTFGQLGIPFHTAFAKADVQASGATGFGGHFGILADVTDRIHLGARYLMQVKMDYDGTAKFEPVATNIVLPPGNPLSIALGLNPNQPLPLDPLLASANLFSTGQPLEDQTGATSITMPWQLTAGAAVDVTDRLTVLADYQFVHWNSFDRLTLDFSGASTPDLALVEDYKDTHAARLGVEYVANDKLTLRGGYLYHTAAAPAVTVTPLLPEGKRNEFTVGLGWQLLPQLHADVAYQYIRQQDRRGRVVSPPSGQAATLDMNSGLYSFKAHLVAATFVVRF